MMRIRLSAAILLASAVGLPVFADQQPTSKEAVSKDAAKSSNDAAKKAATKPATPPKVVKTPAMLAAEREEAALDFAREHHPELAALIDKLHHDNRREYDRAIRELSQVRERLVRLKKLSSEQYDLALVAWKLDSRTKLLAARLTVAPTPGLEAELKKLLTERAAVRLKEYQSERTRLQDRLGKLNTWIEDLETDQNAVVEKDVQRMMRSIARSRRPANRPVGKTSPPSIASKRPASSPAVIEPPRPPAVPTAASLTGEAPSGSRASDKQQ